MRSTSLPGGRPSLLMKIQKTQQSDFHLSSVREFSDAGDFSEAGFDLPQQQLSTPVVMPTVSPDKGPERTGSGRRSQFSSAGGVSGAGVVMWPQAIVNIEEGASPKKAVMDGASFAKFRAFDTREDLHEILNLVNI